MKKISSLLTILFAISFAAHAQTVGSANVMGYTKITIPSNQYVLVSLDFENTNNTINDLFGDLPTGAQVSTWDIAGQSYVTFAKTRGGWGTGGTNKIEIGSGIFLKLPADSQETTLLSGDVPNEGTSTVSVVSGYKLLAYPYPAGIAFTNTSLAKDGISGDQLSIWNNGWTTYARTRGGWSSEVNDLQLEVGQAFFYNSSSARDVDEIRPYSID